MLPRSRVTLASEALRFFLEELLYMSSPPSAYKSTHTPISFYMTTSEMNNNISNWQTNRFPLY